MTDLRAALAAYLATNEIKLVHIWQTNDWHNAMVEWPYDPVAKKPLPTERHATGVGNDPCAATIAGVERLGFTGFGLRLFLITRMMG